MYLGNLGVLGMGGRKGVEEKVGEERRGVLLLFCYLLLL